MTDQRDDTTPTMTAPVELGERMRVGPPDDWPGIRDWRPRRAELENRQDDDGDPGGVLVGAAR